jgi:hypothetical protein
LAQVWLILYHEQEVVMYDSDLTQMLVLAAGYK